ncbi:hypothetical protein chiPu_0007206 [Chiloscyllium punctatum]|uniref:Uncharacterized protein n=1 Tax=Chiloscyllium punctatum TaxID=137246 RepID=A0A401SEB3_CHIPU|nr:hypothetical protein [Chiloscyllium punctatum]
MAVRETAALLLLLSVTLANGLGYYRHHHAQHPAGYRYSDGDSDSSEENRVSINSSPTECVLLGYAYGTINHFKTAKESSHIHSHSRLDHFPPIEMHEIRPEHGGRPPLEDGTVDHRVLPGHVALQALQDIQESQELDSQDNLVFQDDQDPRGCQELENLVFREHQESQEKEDLLAPKVAWDLMECKDQKDSQDLEGILGQLEFHILVNQAHQGLLGLQGRQEHPERKGNEGILVPLVQKEKKELEFQDSQGQEVFQGNKDHKECAVNQDMGNQDPLVLLVYQEQRAKKAQQVHLEIQESQVREAPQDYLGHQESESLERMAHQGCQVLLDPRGLLVHQVSLELLDFLVLEGQAHRDLKGNLVPQV